jgi:hypothetical protein
MRAPDLTIVGRDSQLEALAGVAGDRLSRAVELAGDPGIGNTRLPAEVGDRAIRDRRGL